MSRPQLVSTIFVGLSLLLYNAIPGLANASSEERNRELFAEYIAAENAADFQRMARLFSDDFRSQVNGQALDGFGPSVEVETVRPLRDAFPDYVASVEQLIIDNSYIVARWKIKGTHTAPLKGLPLPPTNRPVTIFGCTIFEVVDGKITRGFNYVDRSTLSAQLGVMGLLAMSAFFCGGLAASVLGSAGVAVRRRLIVRSNSSKTRWAVTLLIAALGIGSFIAVSILLRSGIDAAL